MQMKTRFKVYLFLLALVIFTMLGLRLLMKNSPDTSRQNLGLSRDYPEMKKSRVIRVIAQYNNFDYIVEAESTSGYIYDLCKLLTERSGIAIEIVLQSNWQSSLDSLAAGSADVIAQTIPKTSETDTTQFRFVDTYSEGRLYLVQRKDSSIIRQQVDMGGITLTVPKASPANLFLRHLSEEIGESIHIAVDDTYSGEQLAMMVASGDIDYTVCKQAEANRLEELLPALDCRTPISFTTTYAWLVRKSSPQLADSLDLWFAEFREQGKLDRLFRQYYGKN